MRFVSDYAASRNGDRFQRLPRPLSCIQPQFLRVCAYPDTLEFFVRRRPRAGIRTEWESALGRPVILTPCTDRNGNLCGHRITIHQPSRDDLVVLDRLQRRFDAILCRFDLAIDWTFPSEIEKARFRACLEKTVLLRWRRKGKMRNHIADDGESTTLYWIEQKNRKRRSTRNLKLYDDAKASKLPGEHRVHLELSFFRAASCRAQGVHKPSDVLALNPRTLFNKHVKLVDGVDNFLRKLIRDEIKADRLRHLARKYRSGRERDFYDKFCRITPLRLEYRLRLIGMLRAQTLKDYAPYWLKEPIPIAALKIPSRMTSRRTDPRFLQNPMISIPPNDQHETA